MGKKMERDGAVVDEVDRMTEMGGEGGQGCG